MNAKNAPNQPHRASFGKAKPSRLSAFTLIELLVVIAVIAILAALIVPALRTAREAGRSAECMNHLHQIGVAISMYVNDHGHFPPGEGAGDPANSPYLVYTNLISQTGLSNITGIYVDQSASEVYRGDVDAKADYLYQPQAISDFGPQTGWVFQPAERHPDQTFYTVIAGSASPLNEERTAARVELVRDIFNEWVFLNVYGQKGVHKGGETINILFMDGHAESKQINDPDVRVPTPQQHAGVWDWDAVYPWY